MVSNRLLFCLFFFFALGPIPGFGQTFVFHLRGDQEVPPVASPASGGCMAVLDQGAAELALTCSHNVTGATILHIHRGAAGANGPIAFDLGDPASPVQATWTGMTPADITELLAGDLYLNIHTAGRPAGEIRGQILPRTVDSVAFTAEGGQVVPSSVSGSTASCSADLDAPAAFLAVTCLHDVAAPTAAHLHSAPFGTNGPLVFTFPSPASPLSANVPMTPLLVADFAAAFLYIDIHEEVPEGAPTGGDIRGQIGDPPAAATTGTVRITKRTLPAGGTGFGFSDDVPGSPGSFALDDGQTQVFLNVPAGTYTVRESDPGVTPGGYALSAVVCEDADSAGDPFARTATIRLQAGEVVTCSFESFRTSAGGPVFVFHLAGEQEVPPVASAARGGCMGRLDAGNLSLLCTHNVTGATIMHIHRGAPGANGDIVFDLGDPASPVQAVWTGLTATDLADLQAGTLYVNIHTDGRPAGEIRGQILPRTVDSFPFAADGQQPAPPSGSPALGDCFADLSDHAAALVVTCSHGVAAATEAHLHDAPAGESGPIVFTFAPGNPFSGNVAMSPRLVADFAAGFLYIDVHTADSPAGEIRGQLLAGQLAGLAIPTLGEWGLLLLALALLALGWRRLAAAR